MLSEVANAMIPKDPYSVARVVTGAVSATVAYAAAVRRVNRRKPIVQEAPTAPLAARIRARMAEDPEIVQMSDALVERVAGVLAPVPAAETARKVKPVNL
jgi:hypothetical protein